MDFTFLKPLIEVIKNLFFLIILLTFVILMIIIQYIIESWIEKWVGKKYHYNYYIADVKKSHIKIYNMFRFDFPRVTFDIKNKKVLYQIKRNKSIIPFETIKYLQVCLDNIPAEDSYYGVKNNPKIELVTNKGDFMVLSYPDGQKNFFYELVKIGNNIAQKTRIKIKKTEFSRKKYQGEAPEIQITKMLKMVITSPPGKIVTFIIDEFYGYSLQLLMFEHNYLHAEAVGNANLLFEAQLSKEQKLIMKQLGWGLSPFSKNYVLKIKVNHPDFLEDTKDLLLETLTKVYGLDLTAPMQIKVE